MGAMDPAPLPPSSSAPLRYLEIRVTDTGIGIKAEDIPKLFKEFGQLDAGRAPERIGQAHLPDQIPGLRAHLGPSMVA